MELPDASLELVFSAEALPPRFKTVAALRAAGAALLAPVACASAGTAFFAAAAVTDDDVFCFTVILASACALLFTVVLVGLATAFVVAARPSPAGASASVIVFASLLATDFSKDLSADRVFGAGVEPTAIFFVAPLALAFLEADLVTVAFIFILFLS
ncbi:MAG TPA: hypothetical protein VJ652_03685 [Noviherbaspirillum sp.]|nr:hypothetical protein [Noviherbaspirillum sp.]